MTRTAPRSSTLLGARALVGLVGLGYVATGIALLASPTWFFATIAPFEPYNRHFLGDIGAFTLPVGVALLVAGARPRRHRALLLLGLGASVIHALNHLYDDLLVEVSLRHTLSDALPLTAAALALGWAVWTLERSARLHPAEGRP